MGIKTIIISIFRLSNCFAGNHSRWHPKNSQNIHVIYPSGKRLFGWKKLSAEQQIPQSPALMYTSACQRFAVIGCCEAAAYGIHLWRLESAASSTFATLAFESDASPRIHLWKKLSSKIDSIFVNCILWFCQEVLQHALSFLGGSIQDTSLYLWIGVLIKKSLGG